MGGYSRIGVVILILIGIAAYLKTGSTLFEKVKNSGARLQIASIDRALHAASLQSRRYPTNFVAFMRKSFDSKNGTDSALDPWGHHFKYEINKNGFLLASAGLDGLFGNDDDITWRREGDKAGLEQGKSGFKGIASSEIKTLQKDTVEAVESPLMKDYQVLFNVSSLEGEKKRMMSDKELLNYFKTYMGQVVFE